MASSSSSSSSSSRSWTYNGCRKLTSLPDSLMEDCEAMERLTCPYNTPYAQLNYTNCFKLDREAQRAIITQPIVQGWACLPGREVPEEFDHRARGSSLTICPMSYKPLTILKVCVVLSPNSQTREFEQLLCHRIRKGDAYIPIDEVIAYAVPRIQREHMFLFPSYLLEEERFPEVTSIEIVFEFSSQLEIVECGVQIWKDESEINNNGGYQTSYGKPGSGDEEDVVNNQQDTYEFTEASYEEAAEEYVNQISVKRTKR